MRRKIVKFRVDDDELQRLRIIAGGNRKVSAFIRARVLSRDLKITSGTKKADPELIRHIGLIGNNINQLARWCNTHKSNTDADQICQLLDVIYNELIAVKEHHFNDD